MSWGIQRRNKILLIFFTLILLPAAIVTGIFIYKPPTCFDGKQNGSEGGVDCDGSCSLVCNDSVIDPIVHWVRFFEVAPGRYNAMSYVENQNPDAGIQSVNYQISLYDRDNVELDTRRGTMTLAPKEIIPLFITGMTTGELAPSRAAFKFTSDLVWTKSEPLEQYIVIQDETLNQADVEPEISATLRNYAIKPITNIKAIVIVYDLEGNAMNLSSSLVEKIDPDGEASVVFTWPKPFAKEVARFEIIPIYERPN